MHAHCATACDAVVPSEAVQTGGLLDARRWALGSLVLQMCPDLMRQTNTEAEETEMRDKRGTVVQFIADNARSYVNSGTGSDTIVESSEAQLMWFIGDELYKSALRHAGTAECRSNINTDLTRLFGFLQRFVDLSTGLFKRKPHTDALKLRVEFGTGESCLEGRHESNVVTFFEKIRDKFAQASQMLAEEGHALASVYRAVHRAIDVDACGCDETYKLLGKLFCSGSSDDHIRPLDIVNTEMGSLDPITQIQNDRMWISAGICCNHLANPSLQRERGLRISLPIWAWSRLLLYRYFACYGARNGRNKTRRFGYLQYEMNIDGIELKSLFDVDATDSLLSQCKFAMKDASTLNGVEYMHFFKGPPHYCDSLNKIVRVVPMSASHGWSGAHHLSKIRRLTRVASEAVFSEQNELEEGRDGRGAAMCAINEE